MKIDGIIFDMDGVLVDVSESYRMAIEMTVNYFLRLNQLKIRPTQEDIKALKEIPGFNNDWDLSFKLFNLLADGMRRSDFSKAAKRISNRQRKTRKYLEVKSVFQAFYLGENLFIQLYRNKPAVNYLNGLIDNEQAIIDIKILKKLSASYKLGVATSRPRFEAIYALKNLKITPDYISENLIIAQEDVLREKPAPDSLLEAKRRMRAVNPIYIGDSINDCLASQKAGMKCIFVGDNKLGDYQIRNVNKIKEILL